MQERKKIENRICLGTFRKNRENKFEKDTKAKLVALIRSIRIQGIYFEVEKSEIKESASTIKIVEIFIDDRNLESC